MNAEWIGIIGGIIGLAVGMGCSSGYYQRLEENIASEYLLFYCSYIFGWLYLIFKPMINMAKVAKTGIPGQLFWIKDTGVTINNGPQLKLAGG